LISADPRPDLTDHIPALHKTQTTFDSFVTMAGEFWIQLFGACVQEQEPQPRRPRIDRSQIGQPMNFRHTGHVGSSDLGSISTLQTQMKGKGDELIALEVPHVMNARSIHELRRASIKA